MTPVIFNFLVFLTILFIVKDKYKIDQKLVLSRIEVLHKIGMCDFCFAFWVAVATTLIINCFTGFQWIDILLPFAVTGLWLLTQRLTHEN